MKSEALLKKPNSSSDYDLLKNQGNEMGNDWEEKDSNNYTSGLLQAEGGGAAPTVTAPIDKDKPVSTSWWHDFLDRFFCISERGSTVKQEVTAGVIVFLTASYVLIVISTLCEDAGVPFDASVLGVAFSIATTSCLIGLSANLPLMGGPSSAVTSYFITDMTASQEAIGNDDDDAPVPTNLTTQHAVTSLLLAGFFMLLLSFLNVPSWVYKIIPGPVKHAFPCGLGLLLAFIAYDTIGLTNFSDLTGLVAGPLKSVELWFGMLGVCMIGMVWHAVRIRVMYKIYKDWRLYTPQTNPCGVTVWFVGCTMCSLQSLCI